MCSFVQGDCREAVLVAVDMGDGMVEVGMVGVGGVETSVSVAPLVEPSPWPNRKFDIFTALLKDRGLAPDRGSKSFFVGPLPTFAPVIVIIEGAFDGSKVGLVGVGRARPSHWHGQSF